MVIFFLMVSEAHFQFPKLASVWACKKERTLSSESWNYRILKGAFGPSPSQGEAEGQWDSLALEVKGDPAGAAEEEIHPLNTFIKGKESVA